MSDGLALHEIIYNNFGKAVDYLIKEVNPAFEKITGLERRNILGRKATEVYLVTEAPYLDIYSQVESTGNPLSFETFFPPMNKHFSVSVFSPGKGKFATVFQDITYRKQQEQILYESREQLSAVFNGVSETLMLLDIEGNVIAANKIAVNRLNQGTSDFVGKNIYDLMPVHFREQREKQILELIRTKKPIKFLDKLNDTFIEITFYPVFDVQGNVKQFISSGLDITERKKAEATRQESEERFRSILNNSHDVIYRLNIRTGKFEYISPSCENVTGFSTDELMAQDLETALAMIHPDYIPVFREAQVLTEKTGKAEVEYLQRAKNGSYRWISNHMTLTRDNIGRPLYRDGNLRDITERKEVENKLKEAREKLNVALETGTIGIWEWDLRTDDMILDIRMESMLTLCQGRV